MSTLGRAEGAALALLLMACGVPFHEPNPPELTRVSRTIELPVREAPVVVKPILDLHLPDAYQCIEVREALLGAVRGFVGSDGEDRLLPTLELAPGCEQVTERRIDVGAVEAELDVVRLELETELRPVFVYVNNLPFPLRSGLHADLESLPAVAHPRGELWAVATEEVTQQIDFDQAVAWTYAGDPELAAALAAIGEVRLPFVSRTEEDLVPLPLLPEGAMAGLQGFKWCNPDPRFTPDGFARATSASGLAPVTSPRLVPQAPPVALDELVPRSELPVERYEAQVELCTAACDRFVSDEKGPYGRWTELPGCVTPLDASPEPEGALPPDGGTRDSP